MVREHVHLIGIGGTGMASLAGLLHEAGCRVTGSDRPLYPPTSTIARRDGRHGLRGYDARHLDPVPDLIVVGNAVSRGNPEAEQILDLRLPHLSMAAAIEQRFLTGTARRSSSRGRTGRRRRPRCWRGSSSTPGAPRVSSSADRRINFEAPYRIGAGKAFVIEGDEYDTAFFDKGPKFMHYRPDTALIGTVEFDHADIYRDEAEVHEGLPMADEHRPSPRPHRAPRGLSGDGRR